MHALYNVSAVIEHASNVLCVDGTGEVGVAVVLCVVLVLRSGALADLQEVVSEKRHNVVARN